MLTHIKLPSKKTATCSAKFLRVEGMTWHRPPLVMTKCHHCDGKALLQCHHIVSFGFIIVGLKFGHGLKFWWFCQPKNVPFEF